jgi:hypothetical protein
VRIVAAALCLLALLGPRPAQADGPLPRLVGTAAVGAERFAIFEDRAGRQVVRRAGDSLGEGLRVRAVGTRSVEVVDDAGQVVVVRPGGVWYAPRALPPGALQAIPGPAVPVPAAAPVPPTDDTEPIERSLKRQGPTPALRWTAGGRDAPPGIRIGAGRPPGALARAGLQPGDVVVGLGGEALAVRGAAAVARVGAAVGAAARSGQALPLEVWRDGARLSLEIPPGAAGE